MEILNNPHLQSILLGLCTFLVIGVCHPLVIKGEYYMGTRCWWLFLVGGIVALTASLLVDSMFWSVLLCVAAFSCFWGIFEVFEQDKRVKKGWFPKNPKRKYKE